MSLICGINLFASSVPANQTVLGTLTIYNPGATAVSISSVSLSASPLNSNQNTDAVGLGLPGLGPGFTTSVAATSSVVVSISVVPYSGGRFTGQLSQPTPYTVMINAVVYGSDGTVNVASGAPLIVSDSFPVAPLTLGGSLVFSQGSNSAFFL